jgi:hypothetical protein
VTSSKHVLYFLSAAPTAVRFESSSLGFHYTAEAGDKWFSLVFANVNSSTGWPLGLLEVNEPAISEPVWGDLYTDPFFVTFRPITAAATPNAS